MRRPVPPRARGRVTRRLPAPSRPARSVRVATTLLAVPVRTVAQARRRRSPWRAHRRRRYPPCRLRRTPRRSRAADRRRSPGPRRTPPLAPLRARWSGAKATSGSESTGALTTTSQFSLSCTGPDGTQSASTVVSVMPPPGPLPAWVNALAIGQWYEIPNTKMSSVPNADLVEVGAKVAAWTSFVADPRTSKVYSVATGGHGDYWRKRSRCA